jgi:exodeoxyribonuclease-3
LVNDVLVVAGSAAKAAERLTVVTWNVNSVRLRLEHMVRLVKAEAPDILCLQETKVVNGLFPQQAFAELGYTHQAIAGMKSYNGVAILSRVPLFDVQSLSWCGRDDCRHISARVALRGYEPIELHNFYVPAGGDKPDAEVNPKFAHKLAFLHAVEQWFLAHRGPHDPLVLVGDLNVAPLATDVYDHKKLSRVITHTPIEILHLGRIQASLGWLDVGRRFVPPEDFLFTWWSYRQRGEDWRLSNRGRRLDHVWTTPVLEAALCDFAAITDARSWEPPSDHVPVKMTLRGRVDGEGADSLGP